MQLFILLVGLVCILAPLVIVGGIGEAIFRHIYKVKGLKWDDDDNEEE